MQTPSVIPKCHSLAALAFEDEVQLGHPAPERRCMICGVVVSKCCC